MSRAVVALAAVVVLVVLVAVACGRRSGDGVTGPSSTMPTPTTAAGTTTTVPATTPATVPPVTTVPPTDRLAVLRPDGLGPFDFSAPAETVEAWLVDLLGRPDAEAVDTGRQGWPLEACAERRFASWAAAGLVVGFTDRTSTGGCADGPQLAAWYVVAEIPWFAPGHADPGTPVPPVTVVLTTAGGVGLGSPAQRLRDREPTVEFGGWDIDTYVPGRFRTATGLSGRVTWNAVTDVQRALDERGADLVVDGILGPRTRAALSAFQDAHGIDEGGEIGPQTLAALDVTVPPDAPVEYLCAGGWDWGF